MSQLVLRRKNISNRKAASSIDGEAIGYYNYPKAIGLPENGPDMVAVGNREQKETNIEEYRNTIGKVMDLRSLCTI